MSYGDIIIQDGNYLYTYGLEIFLTQHCNLSCQGCSASSPFAKEQFASLNDFEISLQKLRSVLRPDRVTLLGGEPLLHPQIEDFIKIARDARMFNKIMVTTNGLQLKKASSSFWNSVDGIEISLYPANQRFILENSSHFLEMAQNTKTELIFYPKSTFNHILFSSKVPAELIAPIFKKCYYKNFTHALHKSRIYRCAPSVFNHNYLSHFTDYQDYSSEQDYFEIEESKNLIEDLNRFLNSPVPLRACSFCAGSSGTEFGNLQIKRNVVPKNDFAKEKLNLNGEAGVI